MRRRLMCRRRSAEWPKPGLLAGLLIKHHLVHLHRPSGAATASRRDLVHRSVGPPQVVFRLTEDQVRAPVALAIDKQHHALGRIGHFLEWSALSAAGDCLANLRCEIVPIAIAAFEPRDAYIHIAPHLLVGLGASYEALHQARYAFSTWPKAQRPRDPQIREAAMPFLSKLFPTR